MIDPSDRLGEGMVRLCTLTDIPDSGVVQINIDGRQPLAVIRIGSAVHVMDDTCTHGAASLSDGFVDVEKGVIECPLHGGTFDFSTGLPVDPPCVLPMNIYSVSIRGHEVFAELGDDDW